MVEHREERAITALGRLGAERCASALSSLLDGLPVDVDVTDVVSGDVRSVASGRFTESGVVAVVSSVPGDLRFGIIVMLPERDARVIVSTLFGRGVEDIHPGTEAGSAITEVGSICIGAYVSALASVLGVPLLPQAPRTAVDLPLAIFESALAEFVALASGSGAESLTRITSRISVKGVVFAMHVILLCERSTAERVALRLGRVGDDSRTEH